jgi:phage host-nuclease inhibitor protein Gam
MAKRIKSDKPVLIPVLDWPFADEYIRQIGNLQMQIKQAEEAAKDDINEVKAELAKKVKPPQDKIKLYVRSLEAFAALHKKDFGKKRSRKLSFGILGWRKSHPISIKKNTLERIKQVFTKAKQKMYIRVKESVDKEALAKLTEEQLASVGARRKEKDVFFVEPSSQEAVDYCE